MRSADEELSDSDCEDEFGEDMDLLKRACQITGSNPADQLFQVPPGTDGGDSLSDDESSGEGVDDDLAMLRSIQQRFSDSIDMEEPLSLKPLRTMLPDWSDSDDCEDDFETLRAIQRRFAAYDDGGLKDNSDDFLHRPEQVGATVIDSEKKTSNSNFVDRTNVPEEFLNCVDKNEPSGQRAQAFNRNGGTGPSDLVEWDQPGHDFAPGLPLNSSQFPKSAHAFVDAIKKNRLCQKFMRSKMLHMEARIEEGKKMTERVKILKDFQISCKRRTGRALSLKRDLRVPLISAPKQREHTKVDEKNVSVINKGPPENIHVANYRAALETHPVGLSRAEWSEEEKQNLSKGLRQQLQGMLLQQSVDLMSGADGSSGDFSNVDSILGSIKNRDITPEEIRLFLPKVNWEQLAAMYLPGRNGAECQTRFLNCEDPLINKNPFTKSEDKNLLYIVQQKGITNWIDIAASLKTNRTPYQCLTRYQRSLNASLLKREWTAEEDNQLREAVETYGESNWQFVADALKGRTGTQCSNRWMKSLHPARKRIGKWSAEEDKRLKVAATLYRAKHWKKVAACVPGRTYVQCRERWVNSLDPSLNLSKWSAEEDSNLEAAIAKHGHCWSKVAACIPRRTDNQCLRRWKTLFPDEVPRLQADRKIQKTALAANFVDREYERPTLGPKDFVPPPEMQQIPIPEKSSKKGRGKGKSRREKVNKQVEADDPSGKVPRLTKGSDVRKTLRKKGQKVPNRAPLDEEITEVNKQVEADDPSGKVPRLRKGSDVRKTFRKKGQKEPNRAPLDEEMTEVNNANQGKKAEKLQRKKRVEPNIKTSQKEVKKERDYLSSFPDSMILADFMKEFDALHVKKNNTTMEEVNYEDLTNTEHSGVSNEGQNGHSTLPVCLTYSRKRRKVCKETSQVLEVEPGDEMTLANWYSTSREMRD